MFGLQFAGMLENGPVCRWPMQEFDGSRESRQEIQVGNGLQGKIILIGSPQDFH